MAATGTSTHGSQLPEQEAELLGLPDHPLGALLALLGAPEGDALRHDGPQVLHHHAPVRLGRQPLRGQTGSAHLQPGPAGRREQGGRPSHCRHYGRRPSPRSREQASQLHREPAPIGSRRRSLRSPGTQRDEKVTRTRRQHGRSPVQRAPAGPDPSGKRTEWSPRNGTPPSIVKLFLPL